MMARARRWTLTKTIWITALCGLGHVGSSILLGALGVVLGTSVTKLEGVEAFRGNLAAWLFIAFGGAYFLWGLYRAIKNRPHTHVHLHSHEDTEAHAHDHEHAEGHDHAHGSDVKSITPWVLFTIFVLGPCEPLIPVLMYPAAKSNTWGLIAVTATFAIVTIATMLTLVVITTLGVNTLRLGRFERYTHAVAGAMIMLSGVGIVFLGL
jgi:ABC-type nickel/cobalt efflux system permease component RcnA